MLIFYGGFIKNSLYGGRAGLACSSTSRVIIIQWASRDDTGEKTCQ